MRRSLPKRSGRYTLTALLAALAFLIAFPAYADEKAAPDAQSKAQAQSRPDAQAKGRDENASDKIDADKLFGAIVKVSTRSVPSRASPSESADRKSVV